MKLTMFYLPLCPHCLLASRYLEQLRAEDPRFAEIEIERIDESRERALADSFDYWYVPCFYLGSEKLHEGHAEKGDIRRVLEAAAASKE